MEKLYLKAGEAYTFNIENRFFAEHIPIITTSAVGGTYAGEVSIGVVNTWQTESGREWTGSVSYEDTGEDLKVYTNDASVMPKTELQKLKIVFTPPAVSTYYLQCAKYSAHVGKELDVNTDYGDYINPQEVYYTCLLRQSNRTYSFTRNSDMFDKFLNFSIPAGVWPRFTNLAPVISGFVNDKTFYNPGDDASLSGLIYDPENDILSYAWSHTNPLTTVSGFSLLSSIENAALPGCTANLTSPPTVETLYTFKLSVSDSDNTTISYDYIPVYSISGVLVFSGWGVSSFMIDDDELPYSYYPASSWVPPVESGVVVGSGIGVFGYGGSEWYEIFDENLNTVSTGQLAATDSTTFLSFAVNSTSCCLYTSESNVLTKRSTVTGDLEATEFESVGKQKIIVVDGNGDVWTIDDTASNKVRKWSSDLSSRTDYTLKAGNILNDKIEAAAITYSGTTMYLAGGDDVTNGNCYLAKYPVSELNNGDPDWTLDTSENYAVDMKYLVVDENDNVYFSGDYSGGRYIQKVQGTDGTILW